MQTLLDHLAVAAPSLAIGADYIEHTLGVRPQPGGAHPRMGTHNLLLRLGESIYLEVIAPDPAAPPPQRPRWFELDRLAADSAPRLATWVARTDDIAAASKACGGQAGQVEPMTRGALSWRITIPADGSLPGDGVAPTLIQWDASPHPATRLDDLGCTLQALHLFHPDPAGIRATLEAIAFAGPVEIHALPADAVPYLQAHIRTPRGPRMLPAAAPA
ncbi:VOC family protein [Bordetella sp. BOR01]|uniref:VOC family protein n=1 Tax=Bordetella sp. BOR01 TaxID=2854779 RepID=UPI001C456A72|nr:VOC family protein [Bordetella sp. BOR01]MBV7486429.1 VOC family protein [Bordetella sp. BOR01]